MNGFNQLKGLIRTLRPKQWPKNGFIFIALIFDRKLLNPTYFLPTLAGFGLLCMVSSTVYLINDLVDIEADRAHPDKRRRPLPSGQLSKGVAIAAAVILPLASLPLAFLLRPAFALVLLGYLVLQIAYSFWLKHMVLIDVMVIATGFVLRVVAGVVLVDVTRFSPWLYLFTTMLSLFLGFGKRRQEILLMEENANNYRAILDHYTVALLDEMIMIVTAMTLLTYSLYTFSAEGLPANHAMMLTIPFLVYGIFRYLYLIHVKGEGGAPDEVFLTDKPLLATVTLFFLTIFVILYLAG
jgi:4-hydroxybenzoate polyprenyltransferase